ncbi:hypothetical protein [uncultured Leifsonia sp.]|uniref:hypothetical protein n=1 Tax=uncultured Leifsonia sp. TaxID=340359 RepID=UPI0025E9773C|nr:hypothetical protein [uncultured Leifsonia sp.]
MSKARRRIAAIPTDSTEESMMKTWKRTVAATAAIVLIATASACSRQEATESGAKLASSFGALIDEQLSNGTLSEFETDVLTRARERGTISQADYESAHDRYRECMARSGVDADERRFPNGVIHATPGLPSAEFTVERLGDIDYACSIGTLVVIDELFVVQQGNPDLLSDLEAAGAACLVREGLAPEGFGHDDFAASFGEGKTDFSSLPFDVRDARAQMCLFVAHQTITFAD